MSKTNATADLSGKTINKRLAYDYEIIHRAHLFNPVFIRDTKICNCGVSVLCTTAEMAMNSIFTACRRLLEMVRVLHLQGYERLRINPGMSPSGCYWRCEILPSKMTVPGNRHKDNAFRVETARYSSGEERKYFGWTDAVSDSSEKLAAKFIVRFDDLSKASKGKDPAYASWYSRMLDETAPDGIIYAYADYPVPKDHLPVHNKPGLKIPHPPSASPSHLQRDRKGFPPSSQ